MWFRSRFKTEQEYCINNFNTIFRAGAPPPLSRHSDPHINVCQRKKKRKKRFDFPARTFKSRKKKEIGILGAFFLDKKKRGAFAPLLCCPSSVRQIELAHGDQRIEIRIDLQAVQGAVLQDIGRPELRGHDLAHPIVAA